MFLEWQESLKRFPIKPVVIECLSTSKGANLMESRLSGMRVKLASDTSIADEFEYFLIDEIKSVGDSCFNDKCRRQFFEKRTDSSFVIIYYELHNIRDCFDKECILHFGKLYEFSREDDANKWHQQAIA